MAEAATQEAAVSVDKEDDERCNIPSENEPDSYGIHTDAMANLVLSDCNIEVNEVLVNYSGMCANDTGEDVEVTYSVNIASDNEESLQKNDLVESSDDKSVINMQQKNKSDPREGKKNQTEDQSYSDLTDVHPVDNHGAVAVTEENIIQNQNNFNGEGATKNQNVEIAENVADNLHEMSESNSNAQSVEGVQARHEEEINTDENARYSENVGENISVNQDERVDNPDERVDNPPAVENLDENQAVNEFQRNNTTQEVQRDESAQDVNEVPRNESVHAVNEVPRNGRAHTPDEEDPHETENNSDRRLEEKTDKDSWTPEDISELLIKAINFHASKKDLRTVIGCGADVNRPMRNGLCPLHYAAYSDYVECVELLLNSGANVNATDDIGYTPLHLAARRGNAKSLEVLIENGAIINFSEPGVEIHQTDEKNKLGYTTTEPLNLAIQNGHPACAKLLLEKGARPNNKYFMGYEICLAPLDDRECLELLLQYGADPNVFNRCGLSPLMKACKDHQIEAVRTLIKYGADVNAICPPLFEQKSVLQFAINSGNIVIINILLGKGVTLSRQGEYKYSALHSAIMKGRAEICRLLLQHGADPFERTDEGATAMMLACSSPELKERREIVQLLLDCGANVNAYSPSFCYFDPYLAPLTEYFKCIGSREGFSIVRLLIRNGARVHFSSSGLDIEQKRLRDPFSVVPYIACLENNQKMFDFVVSAGSNYNPLIIHATENIPEDMKNSLLYTATRPRELKHLIRIALRDLLTPQLQTKVQQLPLPSLLKSYLLFREP